MNLGRPLPEREWQHSGCVRVIDTNRRERSFARNTAAAIAKGEYLHFLDDDDILLPGALMAFWELSQIAKNASWLNGSWQTVDNDGKLINEFHPNLNGNIFALLVSGEGLPLQASLIKAVEFFRIGGYDPSPILTGVEDRDMGRRLALAGAIAYTPAVVAQIRIGEAGSTTNWAAIAEGDRWGREKSLQAQSSFSRLIASAQSSYWRGRVSRAYFASMLWNMGRRNVLVGASRFVSALAMSSLHIFAAAYWRGLRTKIQ